MKMGILEHFLAPSETFHFFCDRFPAPFFTCSPELGRQPTSWMLYNYFVERAFVTVRGWMFVFAVEVLFFSFLIQSVSLFGVQNEFPGIAEYVRNKTRDMVCQASDLGAAEAGGSTTIATLRPALLSLAYDSKTAASISDFDDGYIGSTLAIAAFLNILLPAGATDRQTH